MICSSKARIIFVTVQLISLVATQETLKRGSQGFFGVRGKKFLDQLYPPDNYSSEKDKKNSLEVQDSETYLKRAPMGFFGVRGKKDMAEDLNSNERGSLIGQIDYSRDRNIEEYPLLKAFLEDYYGNQNEILNEMDKRAANIHQFYGVRGKKSYENKRPFDLSFRGKFIGVRGKKDVRNSNTQDLEMSLERDEPWMDKRKGPMGFFGMRGKKWTPVENEELDNQSAN